MKNRSNQPELMDLGPSHYTAEEYNDCLSKLGLVGLLLGGDRATLKAFAKLPSHLSSILDVGCGNGALTLKLAQKYPNAKVVGIDIAADAIDQANAYKDVYEKKHNCKLTNLSFQHRINPQLSEPPKSYDVVTNCLVCHHLTDEQLIQFLRDAGRIARKAIIINDLHRHPLAYALFWLISPLFRNRMLRHDGLISICRGFKRRELVGYLQAAGFMPDSYTIKWMWAFRWLITVRL